MWRTSVLCLILYNIFGFVVVSAKPRSDEDQKYICEIMDCTGEEYQCINEECFCARGFIPNPFQNRCMKCPGIGDTCFGPCCSENITLTCWQGVCQKCYDTFGNWICRDSMDQILLITSTQIAMATALVLGIIATFMMLYKLCSVSNLRPIGGGSNYERRLSIGSLQLYIQERLRDAPPRYTRNPPPGTTAIPATVFVNSGFIHDCSVLPPPPYTPSKSEETQQATIHI